MTSSVGRITRRGAPSRSLTSWNRLLTAWAPCSRTPWRTVVSGGSRWAAKSRSSNPASAVLGDLQAALADHPQGTHGGRVVGAEDGVDAVIQEHGRARGTGRFVEVAVDN